MCSAASWRVSQFIGMNVKNAAEETIGEVEDLMLDMKAGEIPAVVISSQWLFHEPPAEVIFCSMESGRRGK